MKTITKTFAGIMALALTLGIAGCGSAKGEVSQERALEAFDKFGAEDDDDLEDMIWRITNYRTECEGGYYYTTDDKDEAKLIVENVVYRFDEIPDMEYQACTYFAVASKEDESFSVIYVITFDNARDAVDMYNSTLSDMANKDHYASGSSSDIYYAVCNEDSGMQSMYGVYVQGNNLLYIRAVANDKAGLKPYENIIKDMGLRSPLSA